MANTILSSGRVCDGFDLQVSRDGRNPETVHFPAEPASVQTAVDAWAAGMAEFEAAQAAADDWQIVEA